MFQMKKVIVLVALTAAPQLSWAKLNCTQLPKHWLRAEIQDPGTVHGELVHLRAYGVYRAMDLFCGIVSRKCTGFLNGEIVEGNLKKIENSHDLVEVHLTSVFAPGAYLTGDEVFVCSIKRE